MRLFHPDLLALVALAPAAAWVAARLWRRRIAAAEAWAARGLWDRLLCGWDPRRTALSVVLVGVAVAALAVALARPRWGTSEQTVDRRGVDLVFVVDDSLSMGARDVHPSRLEVAKTLVRRLVHAMPGNRVALVGAEGDGVVLVPLTTNAAVIDLVLDGLQPGSLPTPGTELGNALDLVPRLFPPGTERHRVAVLLSDGEDHGGGLDPRLKALKEAGVVVHTLGLGTPDGAPVPLPGDAGTQGGVKRREDGSEVISTLREPVLEQIARGTGGVYLRAADGGGNLRPVVSAIDSMDKHPVETHTIDTEAERFQWPLALAAAALLLQLALPPFRPAARPAGGAPALEPLPRVGSRAASGVSPDSIAGDRAPGEAA